MIKIFLMAISLIGFMYNIILAKDLAVSATSRTEVVETEGIAPIIDNDIHKAKEVSLNEAFKSALGLVVGVYVSQESLVSKAILIEDNITSQTEGYIESYTLLKEEHDDSFYKTKIKAVVRKEDLMKKIKNKIKPEENFNPMIFVSIDEETANQTKYVENELKSLFIKNGFKIQNKEFADILIYGSSKSAFNEEVGKLYSYQAIVTIRAITTQDEEIANSNATAGGVHVFPEAAYKNSLQNCATKAFIDLFKNINNYAKDKLNIILYVSNVQNMNDVNDIIQFLRKNLYVRDCILKKYAEDKALIEIYLKYGDILTFASGLESLQNISVDKINSKSIEIKLIK